MTLWSRLKRAVRAVIERVTPAEPEPEPPEEPRGGGGIIGDYFDEPDRESLLPPGWSVVGLYHEGEKTERIHATDDTQVTDSQIAHADAIIVWYRDAGSEGYFWIHGADDWESIADQIERTIIVVSLGRGE